jgi:hypothetical protein
MYIEAMMWLNNVEHGKSISKFHDPLKKGG